MSIEAIAEELARVGEDDWIGMCVIVADVADALDVDDSEAQLEAALVVVRVFGWFASALETAPPRLLYLGVVGIMVLGLAILVLHHMIARCIKRIRSL